MHIDLIDVFGYNSSYLLSPPFFGLAAIAWSSIGTLGHKSLRLNPQGQINNLVRVEQPQDSYFRQVARALKAFARAFYVGALLIFSHRRFIWLVPGYSFALYGHR
jgi:hypothetical protein